MDQSNLTNTNLYQIIDDRIGDLCYGWDQTNILYFGIDAQQLIDSSDGQIQQHNYTAISYSHDDLQRAQHKFPEATYIHCQEHHAVFNPNGQKRTAISTVQKYDVAIVYDLFNHCELHDIQKIIGMLQSQMNSGGIILFDIEHITDLLGKINGVQDDNSLHHLLPQARMARKMIYLINKNKLIQDRDYTGEKQIQSLDSFYSPEYISYQIPNAILLPSLNDRKNIYAIVVE